MEILLGLDWPSIGTLAGIVLLASIVANFIAFSSRLTNALFTVLFFVIFYIVWISYIQGMMHNYLGHIPTVN